MDFLIIKNMHSDDLRDAYLVVVDEFEEADEAQDSPEWHSFCQQEILRYRDEADCRGIQLVTLH